MEAGLVTVDIYGKSYTVRSHEDKAYIGELASLVDGRMRQVAEHTATVDSLRVAVLAALHIADECMKLRSKNEQLAQELKRRSTECLEILDECLQG